MAEVRRKALVSGKSIAGPVTAYWLDRAGYDVTVVERSPHLRGSGQNVDVRGTGRTVLQRMNLEATVLANSTTEQGTRFVDPAGRTLAEFSSGNVGHDGLTAGIEILRGEFARILVDTAGAHTHYRFGDRVVGVAQDADGVDVTFAEGDPSRYELVVLADGMRSSTRELVFPGEARTRELGLYFAYGVIPRSADDDRWWRWFIAGDGKVVTLRPDNLGTTRFMVSWTSPGPYLEDLGPSQRVAALRSVFADVGWEAPRVLDALDAGSDVYFDYIAQVHAPRWTTGRVALVGDAAWCATPITGMGTTLAIVGAHVLASELAKGRDHREGLRAYEARMRPFVRQAQKLPPGVPRVGYPRSRLGVAAVRTALRVAGAKPLRPLANKVLSPGPAALPLPAHAL